MADHFRICPLCGHQTLEETSYEILNGNPMSPAADTDIVVSFECSTCLKKFQSYGYSEYMLSPVKEVRNPRKQFVPGNPRGEAPPPVVLTHPKITCPCCTVLVAPWIITIDWSNTDSPQKSKGKAGKKRKAHNNSRRAACRCPYCAEDYLGFVLLDTANNISAITSTQRWTGYLPGNIRILDAYPPCIWYALERYERSERSLIAISHMRVFSSFQKGVSYLNKEAMSLKNRLYSNIPDDELKLVQVKNGVNVKMYSDQFR